MTRTSTGQGHEAVNMYIPSKPDLTTTVVSNIPGCDICRMEFPSSEPNPAVADGRTKQGPWAYMCETHLESLGVGLGVGRGQRLVTAD